MGIITVGLLGGGIAAGSIAEAAQLAHPGDTIELAPGTYTNDFPAVVLNGVSVVAVGGMAHLVATAPPSNQKAWFVTTGAVTLQNLDVSGVHVADLNGAPVRYQGGDLRLVDDYFHDNDEGLLAPADPNGSILIDHSEFAFNGSNGFSHNVYIDNVGTVTVTDSFIHDVLGHGSEFRSRGANTTITDSVIADLGHADNYTLDLPAGGNVTLVGDVLEKAAGATNPIMLHFGPGGVVPFHVDSSLTITDTAFLNAGAPGNYAIGNFSALPATLENDMMFGILPKRGLYGPGDRDGLTLLDAMPAIDLSQPWMQWQTSPPSDPPVGLPLALADPPNAAVPEPSPAALLLTALPGLALLALLTRAPARRT